MENIIYISAGNYQGAVVDKDYNLYTWGHNEYGELGLGFTTNWEIGISTPTKVTDSILVPNQPILSVYFEDLITQSKTEPTTNPVGNKPTENTTNSTETIQKYLSGDANLDGTINIRDATIIQMYLAKISSFTSEQLTVADVNRDGTITISDATLIQMYLAKYDVILG